MEDILVRPRVFLGAGVEQGSSAHVDTSQYKEDEWGSWNCTSFQAESFNWKALAWMLELTVFLLERSSRWPFKTGTNQGRAEQDRGMQGCGADVKRE
jgi:hypothetical protein